MLMRVAIVTPVLLSLSLPWSFVHAQKTATTYRAAQASARVPETKGSLDCLNQSLSERLSEEMRGGRIQAIAVFAAKAGRPVCSMARGLADIGRNRPATVDTPFAVASVTKAFVGTDLALLASRGSIDLKSPANAYLRGPKLHSPFWDPTKATVAMLAGHTAGLTSYDRTCSLGDPRCKSSLQTAIARFGILFWPPGDHFDYSNLGYGILGEILEIASKESLARALDDALFRPLELTNCYLHESDPPRADSAVSYVNPTHAPSSPESSDTPGSSSAYCSARDLTRFGEAFVGVRPASWSTLSNDLEFRSFSASAGVPYSFGWFERSANGHVAYMAQGGTDRAFAILEIVPDSDLVIAVVANTGTDFPTEVVNSIIDMNVTSTQTEPAREPVTASSRPSLSGKWTGTVHTPRKDRRVTIDLVSARNVRMTLDSRSVSCVDVE